eukprot:scaffold31961_cov32-Tisochrysis_lutea.AAC.2
MQGVQTCLIEDPRALHDAVIFLDGHEVRVRPFAVEVVEDLTFLEQRERARHNKLERRASKVFRVQQHFGPMARQCVRRGKSRRGGQHFANS